jgi:solute:Na+ symporter, SSS family
VVARDVYGRHVNPAAPEKRQVLVGKIAGVVAVAILLVIAWNPPGTLYDIFVLKFELIVQLAPVFMLGLYWRRMAAGPAFWGMLAGALIAGGLTLAGVDDLGGVPGGLLGLAVNVGVCVIGSLVVGRPDDSPSEDPMPAQEATVGAA